MKSAAKSLAQLWGDDVPPSVAESWQSFGAAPSTLPAKRAAKPMPRPTVKPEPGPAEAAANQATAQVLLDAGAAGASELEPVSRTVARRRAPVKREPASPPPEGERIAAPTVIGETPAVLALETHNNRDDQWEMFRANMERIHTPTADMLTRAPPPVDPLRFCVERPDEFPWARAMLEAVADDPAITFQRTPVLHREYLMSFLREPDPACPWERSCINLDREPQEHETLDRCAAHEVSAEQLGPERAYRCRELLLRGEMVLVREALDRGEQPSPDLLPQVPEMCLMCHIRHVFRLCLKQRNADRRRQRKDLTMDARPEQTMLCIFNRFMVCVDTEGEYKRSACISYDSVSIGLSGPFVRWSPKNYVACAVGHLRGFEEIDEKMVFHDARVSRDGKGTMTGSSPSAPTAAPIAASNSRH